MNANQMKHAANLAEWKQRIMDCRASGISVRAWCEGKQVSPSTYYRWERELFGRIKKMDTEGAAEPLACEALLLSPHHDLVEVPLDEPTCATMTPPDHTGFCPVAVIRIGQMELSLTNAVSAKLMKQIKELIPDAE